MVAKQIWIVVTLALLRSLQFFLSTSTRRSSGATFTAIGMSAHEQEYEGKAIVVGAGPVGCLAALALSKLGWQVEIYEGRPGKFKKSRR